MSVENYNIDKVVQVCKAIANENRLKVLYLIADREMSVGELMKKVDLSQSALSQHLAVLRGYNIVRTRRSAQVIYYQLKSEKVKRILQLLAELF